MLFLTFSNVNIQFVKKKLIQRSYIIAKALPIIKRIEIIDKKEFSKAALDRNIEAFGINVIFLNFSSILIYPAKKAQTTYLITEKIKISTKYSDFLDVFLEKKTLMLLKLIKLNQHAIKLRDNKKLLYRTIYSLRPIKFKILKIYIKTNLVNSFIQTSKSLANAFIFFVQKLDSSLQLCRLLRPQ